MADPRDADTVDPGQLDVVLAALFAGLALNERVTEQLHAAGFDDVRFSHGFVFQHLVPGPLAVGELARRMDVSQQAASKAAAELERLGYLERAPDPARRAGAPARAQRPRAGGGHGRAGRARGGRGGARRGARPAPDGDAAAHAARRARGGRRAGRRARPARAAGSLACLIVTATISVTHASDPGCPWAYSAWPAHAVLHWRYGAQLDWRLALIGLTEDASAYDARGYTPERGARGYLGFRRYGMPFDTQPRERNIATGRACRAVVAARLQDPASELPAFRALQMARFTTTTLFDTDDGIRSALAAAGLDGDAIVAAIDDAATEAAYQEDRALVRTAAGSPTEFQGKAANSDGAVRYTAPSLIFTHADGRTLEAGGFQTAESYDVILANLDTGARPARARRGCHRSARDPAVRAHDAGGRRRDGAAPRRALTSAPPRRR